MVPMKPFRGVTIFRHSQEWKTFARWNSKAIPSAHGLVDVWGLRGFGTFDVGNSGGNQGNINRGTRVLMYCNPPAHIDPANYWFDDFSPPARWGLLDFIKVTRGWTSSVLILLVLLLLLLVLLVLIVLVSPAADRSGNCRTASASSRSQWALPDLMCELQIPVGNAGPQPRAPDPSGQRRTSTASSRSQWATPDLNGELPIPVGNAGPQPRAPDPSGQRRTSTASSRSQWATPDLNGELPIPVGNAGPQLRGPHPSGQRRTSTASSDRISDRMPDRMSDRMSERMAERYAR